MSTLCAHIMAAFAKSGITVNGKSPKSRVAMILTKLEEIRFITRTFTGAGKVPHRYMAKEVLDKAIELNALSKN